VCITVLKLSRFWKNNTVSATL